MAKKWNWVLTFIFVQLMVIGLNQKDAFGYGTGISTHPLPQDDFRLTTEFVGHVSRGKGMGMQARFTKKLNPTLSVDGGAGFTDGKRSGRFFLSTDIEFYPDFENQPRIALKPFWENAKEFGSRKNIVGLTPLVSKGFKAWDHDIYPFFGLPTGLSLNQENKSYELRMTMALGMTGNIPFEGYENLLINFEGNINLNNSFSGLFLGLSYPI